MPMIRAMRLLNAIEAGTTSSSQLEALLSSDPGRAAEFGVLCGIRALVRRMLSASTTMSAIFGSSTALSIFAASPTSVILGAQDPLYGPMMVLSSVAKMAIFNSDIALNALLGSPAALTRFRSSAQYVVRSASSSGAITVGAGDGAYIALGFSSSNAAVGHSIALTTLRPGSSLSSVVVADSAGNTGSGGAYYPRAIPLVSSFAASMNTSRTWYFGMLRCDV